MPGGGLLQISSDGEVRMGTKIKTQIIPRAWRQTPQKSPEPKFNPMQKNRAEFCNFKL